MNLSVSADLGDGANWSEESECFSLLNIAVTQDNRFTDSEIFPDGDLSKVLYDEASSSYYDFSSYSNFWNIAALNPENSGWSSWDDYYFEARRNNIGTIVSWNNYVLSQISWFWRDSNFDFPLESKTGDTFGDKYKFNGNFFKEYVLYTHHLKSSSEGYPLMSCGIVKVIPLEWRTFSDINESGYMTNILNGVKKQENLWNQKCASWFEWSPKVVSGEKFYQMKANVCVQSYDESDYLKMEVISIAYDNDSERINEYYTNPLQVEAMRNNSNHADGLKWIQDVFREKLEDETCYSVIHWSKSNLPARCDNKYGPISYEPIEFSLWEFFFPVVYAERSNTIDLPHLAPEEEEDTGMLVYGDLPYNLYKKLETIPDESFREYMLISILPNFEELIHHREENNVLLTPFEEVFSSCGLDYNQRLSVVKDFLIHLDVENFSLSQLQYSDESYGDCIIPYPDADKISFVVAWSFDSNQLLAEKLTNTYFPEWDNDHIDLYIQKREALLAELNKNLKEIESRFNTWEIDVEQAAALKILEQEKFQWEIDKNNLQTLTATGSNNNIWSNINIIQDSNRVNYRIFLLIGILLAFGIGLVGFVIYRKHKK